ncbi:MAG TPA: hypothetical protein DCE14_02680 [Kosmotogaceae bacterium]|nr:MAG: Uncharacterized protein XE05_0181 [Thermotogales bacterium 46_20]HAA85239.1 hypothetical protein [Kosmotogaceae bacterium]
MGKDDRISYIKEFKRIESEYREKLSIAKTPVEVGDTFIDYVHGFLKSIHPDIKQRDIEYIEFDPEIEPPFRFEKPLDEKIKEVLDSSDLESILLKMAEPAKHRYRKFVKDEDRTELFRRHE